MKAIGVIPARYGSTRFPGKPLKMIGGKPLLQWVVEGAKSAKTLEEIWVATDHEEIYDLARRLDVKGVMTSPDLPSGSDRVFAATVDTEVDIVVNIQGDEPLITGDLLDQIVSPMLEDETLPLATMGRRMQPGDLDNKNTVKIVLNDRSEALYFSRLGIPYSRQQPGAEPVCLTHIGLYAFRKSFLGRFCKSGPCALELAEGLEQLRALFLGARIRVVQVQHESQGVDTPEDIAKVEAILKTGGLTQ